MKHDEFKQWSRSELEAAFNFLENLTLPTKHGRGSPITAIHILIDQRIEDLTQQAMGRVVETPEGLRFFNETKGRIEQLKELKQDGLGFLEELAEEIDETKPAAHAKSL